MVADHGNKGPISLVCACLVILSMVGCLLKPGSEPSDLTYKLPTTLTIHAGEALPGTDITYEYMSEKGAHMVIEDQEALKRKGDSLDWKGTPLPGVSVDLKLRIVWYTEEDLHAVGTVKITITDVHPQATVIPKSSPIKYGGPVVYGLAKGATMPGSTLTFEGTTDEGVRLGSIEGYPYRKVGDSILWEGMLIDGIYISLDVRILQFDEKSLRVGGLATLWIGPTGSE